MMRQLLLVCGTILVGIFALFQLRPHEPRADLTYVNPSGIHTLDPARMSWTQDFRVALNIWEGLTTWHPETTAPIGGVADYPPKVSADGLTYTFTIRDDARWANGEPVTAADFIRGWRRSIEPGTATDYAFLITDHVVGAAGYVEWRQAAVGALTALERLSDGWGITAQQAEALMAHPTYLVAKADADSDGVRLPTTTDDPDWQRGMPGGRGGRFDWGELHTTALKAHAGLLDERFGDVGLHAVGERTLVVQLTRPCPFFTDLVAMPVFVPIHESIERLREGHEGLPVTAEGLVVYDPQWTKPNYHARGYGGLVTNGAYVLDDWIFKRRARLTVNPFYRDAASIACRTVDMLVMENINASLMAYEAGDVDFLPAMDVPYDHEIARLATSGERGDFKMATVLATYFLNFNCVSETVSGKVNPFRDPLVRRAFALAVDREAIVTQVLRRGDRAAGSFIPPDAIPGYTPPKGLPCNVDAARALLAKARYPNGEGLPPIQLLYTPNDARVIQALARMWEETLGARIDLIGKETRTFAEDKANHRFMIARGNWYADYNDPTTFLDCLATGNGNNDSGYASTEYDAILSDANATRDVAARMRLLQRAEALVVERDFPILPILHYSAPLAIQPYVSGLHPNARLWFPFRYVTVNR